MSDTTSTDSAHTSHQWSVLLSAILLIVLIIFLFYTLPLPWNTGGNSLNLSDPVVERTETGMRVTIDKSLIFSRRGIEYYVDFISGNRKLQRFDKKDQLISIEYSGKCSCVTWIHHSKGRYALRELDNLQSVRTGYSVASSDSYVITMDDPMIRKFFNDALAEIRAMEARFPQ